jgi:pilus assembly protein CpaF
LTTVHANDPDDVTSRLETMVLQSGVSYPLRAIRGQIASALHLIVHVARGDDGRRGIESIAEFAPLDGDTLPVRDLFTRDPEGALRSVGMPTFIDRLPRRLQGTLRAALPTEP